MTSGVWRGWSHCSQEQTNEWCFHLAFSFLSGLGPQPMEQPTCIQIEYLNLKCKTNLESSSQTHPKFCSHADSKFYQVDNQCYLSPKVTLLPCGLSMHLLHRILMQLPEGVAKYVYVLWIYSGTRYLDMTQKKFKVSVMPNIANWEHHITCNLIAHINSSASHHIFWRRQSVETELRDMCLFLFSRLSAHKSLRTILFLN